MNVTDPIGSTVTTANDPQTVTIANGTPATATPVGYQWTGTVTGSIFTDTNGDGIVAGTETNLAGVTVTLTDANGTVFTAITDSTGTYTFTGVPVGAATIVVGTPANTILTTGNAPQSITVSTTPVTPSAIGFQPGGSVSGQLFSDVDGNGVKDATEPTLAGVTVTLTDVYGVVHTTLTDANGMYTFGSVAVGVSTVSVATPAGTVLTTANDPQTVTIVAGVPAAATTIGFQPLGVVSGSVFGDANGNGLINAGETNLSGLTVTLVDALGVTHTTVTDVNGNYTFTGIPVGTATVDVTDPANATLTTANDAQTITVVQGVAATTTPVGFSVNVAPVYTAAATNTAQTVGLGAALTSVGATDANTDPLVYTLTSGTLPAGVTLNADGTFTGTPSTAGTFVVTISVADGRGGVATTTLTIEVPAATTTTTSSTSTTSTTSTTTTIVVPDSTTTTTVVVPDSTTTTTVVVPDSSTTTTVVVPDSTTSTTPTTSTPPTSTVVGITSTTGVPPTTGVPSVTTTTVADPATSTTTTMVPEVTTTTLVAPTTTLVAPSTTVPPVVTTFVFPTIPEATIPTTTPTTTPETTTTTVAPLVFEPVLPVETPATSTQPTTSIQPTTAVPNTTRTPTDIPGVGNATVSSSAPIVVEEAPANTPGTPSSDPLASVQSSEPVLEIGASATGVTSAKPAAQPTVTTVPTVLAVPTVPKAPKIQVTDDAQTVLSGKSVSIDVLANDEVDATLVFVSKPAHGRAVLVQGRVVYISDDGFDGEDGFDYWITLPTGQKLKGRVVLQVKGNSFTRDLALTGSNSLSLTGSALALLALGLILLLATKRRNDEAAETLR